MAKEEIDCSVCGDGECIFTAWWNENKNAGSPPPQTLSPEGIESKEKVHEQ
jgi:uncharacterized protein (DUF2237 family)